MIDTASLPGLDPPDFPRGLVWLLGAGPGDPGLMTLHGLHAIRTADVIVHDALVNEAFLEWRRDDAEAVHAGKRGGKPSPQQRDISLKLIEFARAGKRVLRLKGGDPFVFGRGGEEAQTLVAAGVPIRVTPGITAGIGGLAYAGIPATHRDVNQSVTFLTGHDRTGLTPSAIDWSALAKGAQVLVIYMAIKHLPDITDRLIAGGRDGDEPVAVVTDATLPTQRVLETTLGRAAGDVAEAGVKPPAIICVGRAVQLRRTLNWAGRLGGGLPRDPDPPGSGTGECPSV